MPEAFLKQLARKWAMTLRPKKLIISERFACKRFNAIGRFGGTSIRVFQIGSGQCSLPSIHHSNILLPCVDNTLLRTEANTSPSHRRSLTPTLSRHQMTIQKKIKDSLFF